MNFPQSIVLGSFCFLCSVAPVKAGESSLKITEMAVTTKVVKGNPIDSVRRISSRSVKALFCFTRIANPDGKDSVIKHVWYKNDQPAGEQELAVKGEKWRTWSRRDTNLESVGEWRVDALDRDGKLLKSVKFRIN